MCHTKILNPSVFTVLLQIDQEIARLAHQQGCDVCGAPLHWGNYARKPRGLPPDNPELFQAYCTRFSLCCSHRECRKRHTPMSVRFWGQRVYVGFIVVLMSALVFGLTPSREQKLLEDAKIPKQTLSRWVTWWRNEFIRTEVWQILRTQFLNADCSLLGLLDKLNGKTLIIKLIQVLKFLLPLTSKSSRYIPEVKFPQNL